MADQPSLVLHVIPASHPCIAARAALKHKGLEYELERLAPGPHGEEIERIYGPGKKTVPGMLVDGEPVHGSVAIFKRLDELAPEPALYPAENAEAVREAERWADEELQVVGRHLVWGALHFRPEALGTYGGGDPLDPAGTNYAIRLIRGAWRYNEIGAELVASDLQKIPELIDEADRFVDAGTIGGEQPTAADFQIGATLRLFLTIGDLRPHVEGRPCETVARRWFPQYRGEVPAGAFPAGWVPAPASA